MRKQILLRLVALALISCSCGRGRPRTATAELTGAYSDPLDRVVQEIAAKSSLFPGRKIVVYEFQDISGRLKEEGKLVAERLTTKLVRTGEFEVIERSRLEGVFQEIKLSASGVIDEKTAVEIGKILGADVVVSGSLARVNTGLEINARAINVSSGRIIAGAIVQSSESSLKMGEAAIARLSAQHYFPDHQPRATLDTDPGKGLPGWEIWPGLNNSYGRFSLESGRLAYYITDRQHDAVWAENQGLPGYYPGLLLAREIKGEKWKIDIKADYILPAGEARWLSCFVWIGKSNIRPSWKNPGQGAGLGLFQLATRTEAQGIVSDFEGVHGVNTVADKRMSKNIRYFRFRREGSNLYLATSADGIKYEDSQYVDVPADMAGASQKIVIGGQAYAGAEGSSAKYDYIKLNGKNLF